ncbi:MAG: hydantoinase/oxoprolinase N-terminal domain-containing protein [Rhizobiaceae bacterium]
MTRLGIDIGARHVDLALADHDACRTLKLPVEGRDAADAILRAIDGSLARWQCGLDRLEQIRIGSTGAVNLLLSRAGPRIGLLTTRGFADTLRLGRQNRADLYDPVARAGTPDFLVPPEDIATVGGRLGPDGAEAAPLDMNDLEKAARHFEASGVEAVAICLLFAHVDAAHEERCAAFLQARLPGVHLCLSSAVDGRAREYERTVATCLEAWLRPSEQATLDAVEAGLARRGFGGRLRFADARGWLLAPAAARHAVSSLLPSGPAAAAGAAASLAARLQLQQAVAIDCGSTTTEIALIGDGVLASRSDGTYAGVPMRRPRSDVESISLGGASALPDGQGGTLAFEAAMADPASAGGSAAAEKGLLELSRAVLRHCVSRNVDPSDAALIAMGGMGGIVACGVADRLGMSEIILPAGHGTAGAWGLHLAREIGEARSRIATDCVDLTAGQLSQAASRLRDRLGAGEGALRFSAEVAASAHMHGFEVELGRDTPTPDAIAQAISEHHRLTYGIPSPGKGHLFTLNLRRLPEADTPAWPEFDQEWIEAAENARETRLRGPDGDVVIAAGWQLASASPKHLLLARRPGHE